MKHAIIIIAALSLPGCSTLSALDVLDRANPLSEDKGLSVDAQLGQNNDSREVKAFASVEQQSSSTVNNDIYSDSVEQITNNKDSAWIILLLVLFAGFVIPSPSEIYNSIKSKVK